MKAITAKRLDEWSITTHDYKRLLSDLVSRLARATAPGRRDLRFPSGDSFNVPNYDGRLISEKGAPYVPVGQSVWEFGAGEDYVDKARDDIKQRSADPRGIVKEDTTLVFCTSREWDATKYQLTTFEAEMRKAYPEWKDIKIVDAVILEHWCEDAPAVADQFARERGWVPSEGAVGLTTFWERYSADFDPQLIEGVALAARAEEAKELVERLQSQAPGTVQLQSESTSEVVAFVAAAIRTSEEETRKYLEARCIVVESQTAADALATNSQLIFILTGAAAARASYLGKTNIVVVPLANDPMNTSASIRRLTRPTRHEFEDALKPMFADEAKARKNALISSGSLSVLRRHCWAVTRPRPTWHTNADLVPATLAGTWDVRREADRKVLAELSRAATYDDYEKKLRPLLTGDDGPIERVGDVWRMQAPFDALVWMADHISKTDIEALEAVTLKVFAERDKNLDAPEDQAYEDVGFTHSAWLRKGLANSLLHFAVLDGKLPVRGLPTQSTIDALVAKIPGLSDDADTLANLRDVLPTLAEAAPRPFDVDRIVATVDSNGNRTAITYDLE